LQDTIGKMCSYVLANGGGFVYKESEERLMVNLNIFITSLWLGEVVLAYM